MRGQGQLLQSDGLPEPATDESVWHSDHRSIVDLVTHLHANGTCIIMVFLHLSKEEQRHRLLNRIDESDKNWKFSASDIAEREFWDAYMQAYGPAPKPERQTRPGTSCWLTTRTTRV